jgi:hypothetical protein
MLICLWWCNYNTQNNFDKKETCSNKSVEWKKYMEDSIALNYMKSKISATEMLDWDFNCETNIFYSESVNSCIWTFVCWSTLASSKVYYNYWIVDYLTKEFLLYCSWEPFSFKYSDYDSEIVEKEWSDTFFFDHTSIIKEDDSKLPWTYLRFEDNEITANFDEKYPLNKFPNVCWIIQQSILKKLM